MANRPAKDRRLVHPLLLAAVAAVGVAGLSSSATAQHRVPQEGDALDASNRVGSGGSNRAPAGSSVNDRYRLGNNIVTGNVTGGRAFRGPVPYGSTADFRDFTGEQPSSRFTGISTGVSGGQVINNAQYMRPYYGSGQVVNPPRDFVRLPGTGGYVPQEALAPIEGRLDATPSARWSGNATRLDPRIETNLTTVQPPADIGPLFTLPAGQSGLGLDGGRPLSPYTQLSRDVRLEPFTSGWVGDLRSEILRDAQGNPLSPEQLEQLTSDAEDGGGRLVDSAAPGAQPVEGAAGTMQEQMDAAIRRNSALRLADPAEQSSQYAQLLERLDRFRRLPTPDPLRPLGGDERPEGEPEPGVQPGAEPGAQPGQPQGQPQGEPEGVPGLPSFIPPPRTPIEGGLGAEPVVLRTLSQGVTSPTLARLYDQAEQLMDEGRYVSAIARYDVAERFVPNQPLTILGRSMAELGAGYFRRSAESLRAGFTQNPELLMARLDLVEFIGAARLAEIDQGLRERLEADADPDSAFLLGFLAYHAGDRAAAAQFLAQAAEGSGDDFYAEVARHWRLEAPDGLVQPPATRPSDE
jgi:tetratricopeptide (TPR) repeat protein